jgi:hypothetical protein
MNFVQILKRIFPKENIINNNNNKKENKQNNAILKNKALMTRLKKIKVKRRKYIQD